jgi:hypothetical protein
MKMFNKFSLIILVAVFAFGSIGPNIVSAATTPSLGLAGTFGILSGTFTRNIAVTGLTGDLGYTTLSGSGSHTIVGDTYIGGGLGDATYQQAGIDQGTALTALNNQPCTHTFPDTAIDLATDTTHGPIGVYTPGVYCTQATRAAEIGTGGITLNGAGTYIFRINGAFTSVANSNITLSNGASSCDVFWTPTSATTLAANTTFTGTVIDAAGITVGANTIWTGRALVFGGTVTTDTDTINTTCTTSPIIPAPTTGCGDQCQAGYTPVPPLINVIKIPTPLDLPIGPGSVTYDYTVTNIGIVAMSDVTITDNKCSSIGFVSGDINGDSKLDVSEVWKYRCTTTLAETTTNTVTVTGKAYDFTAMDVAVATVVVGVPFPPPLIQLVKKPNVFVLPAGGGMVTYTYTVTNPGTEPLSNVTITDDKCTGLPGRVSGHPGDINNNDLLESSETWSFTCQSNITQTTTNTGVAQGAANGLTATDFALATVVVNPPKLPSTGIPPAEKTTTWYIIIILGVLLTVSASVIVIKKRSI